MTLSAVEKLQQIAGDDGLRVFAHLDVRRPYTAHNLAVFSGLPRDRAKAVLSAFLDAGLVTPVDEAGCLLSEEGRRLLAQYEDELPDSGMTIYVDTIV